MLIRIGFLLVTWFSFCPSFSQTVSGKFDLLPKQEIRLEGFNGLTTYLISKTTTDEKGSFQFHYSKSDVGVGCLIGADNKPLFIILSGEDIELHGVLITDPASIRIIKGQENQWFEQYAKEHPKREQALGAWVYLEKIYASDPFFQAQPNSLKAIQHEKKRIQKDDERFLDGLPKESYVSWFLPVRKLVSSVSTVAQYRTEEIPSTIKIYRDLDYTDNRLYKSGLLKDAIESHFWLLENSGLSLDSVFIEMKTSMDAMLKHLVKDGNKLNELTGFLFDLLERHSLFQASEYLALKVLNDEHCKINEDLSKQLETYRAMKKGNIAPDLIFSSEYMVAGKESSRLPKKLSEIESNYTLLVFGAGWCPKCAEEMPEMARLYTKWKAQGVEVLFISLDEKKESFQSFTKGFPFLSVCDFKKWESSFAKDFYVFATPTMYLLDNKREILLRPNSVKQIDAWVDWFLIQGNK